MHFRKISMVVAMLLILMALVTVNVFAATEYSLTTCTDDPETSVNEQAVCAALISEYGRRVDTKFALEETETCNVKTSVTLNGDKVDVWLSKALTPKTTNVPSDEDTSLSDVIDCMIELEKEIDILVIVTISVIVLAGGCLVLNIITRYKFNKLKDEFNEYVTTHHKPVHPNNKNFNKKRKK